MITTIAKYNGFCNITNQRVVAGETVIARIDGKWQVAKSTGEIEVGSVIRQKSNGEDESGNIILHRIAKGRITAIYEGLFMGETVPMCDVVWFGNGDHFGNNYTSRLLVSELELA